MGAYLYRFGVDYWASDIEEEVEERGIICANNISEATRAIEESYGRGNVYKLNISLVEDVENGIITDDLLGDALKSNISFN